MQETTAYGTMMMTLGLVLSGIGWRAGPAAAASVTRHTAAAIEDQTEAAYRRGTALEKRRRLMDAWGKYCASAPAERDKVVPLRGAG